MVDSKILPTFASSNPLITIVMPTVFIVFGFVFMFYSDDHNPIHVHVIKDGHEAKYNVDPEIVQIYNHGFKKHEISLIESCIEENREVIVARWKEYFKNIK